MKPFLILQLRPETPASDNEFEAILAKSGLAAENTRRIRLDCEPIPADLNPSDFSGTIVGGGPGCVSDNPATKSEVDQRIEDGIFSLMPKITNNDLPFLGCCYGIGILASHLGARVSREKYGEPVGAVECTLTEAGRRDPVLEGLPDRFQAFVGHKEAAQNLPEGCSHLASSPTCPYQLIRFGQNVYATQFHPELDADGLEFRVGVYLDYGYFPPSEAMKIVERGRAANVTEPELILKNFVKRYAAD
ncbi:glutamine amidotransferase [Amaricoccus tamworthensis]|uniref:glutamine amidotransferase n=1 Tax=Amaricoccus tamworthensis TaxID=57002 RepID=UPI003C7A9260